MESKLSPEGFITLPAADFIGWLKKMKPFVSTEETRHYLNGIFFTEVEGTLFLVATDGHKLIRIKTFAECQSGLKAIVPISLVATVISAKGINKDTLVTLKFNENSVEFDFGDIKLGSKLIDATYPDYNRVIPEAKTNQNTALGFNAKYIIDVCKAVGNEGINIAMDSPTSPAIISSPKSEGLGITVVLMPMRL